MLKYHISICHPQRNIDSETCSSAFGPVQGAAARDKAIQPASSISVSKAAIHKNFRVLAAPCSLHFASFLSSPLPCVHRSIIASSPLLTGRPPCNTIAVVSPSLTRIAEIRPRPDNRDAEIRKYGAGNDLLLSFRLAGELAGRRMTGTRSACSVDPTYTKPREALCSVSGCAGVLRICQAPRPPALPGKRGAAFRDPPPRWRAVPFAGGDVSVRCYRRCIRNSVKETTSPKPTAQLK
ncbi:hypothetical protein VTJ04DRAFT_7888 [Mycothermus thermophilus]|uniref:uncharacterized protein n=1 Tax=Humicola insolens TaxID=85995 RepID=UPI003742A16B